MNAKVTAIIVTNAALDELPNGEIVLRGVIAPSSLHLLQTDEYQREALPLTALSSILGAFENGETLPDIELGMRGQCFKEGEPGVFTLLDSVYIIDGLQRRNGAVHFMNRTANGQVHLGATIHFGTNKEWERERFRILNTLRVKVSPNVILRNKRDQSHAVLMLYGLTHNEKGFVMQGRVSWSQRMMKGELISALTLAKIVGVLHGHKARAKRSTIDELVPALDRAVELIGVQNMRGNIRAFFDLIDECWGVRAIQYREGATYMRGAFLSELARLLSNHTDFWRKPDEKVLFVDAPLKRKLALFPVNDPEVMRLSGGAGKARELLYMLLLDHVNSGKRTKRLTSRIGEVVSREDENDTQGDEEDAA